MLYVGRLHVIRRHSNADLFLYLSSSCIKGPHRTHPLHWCLHHNTPQPHLHHSAEPRGRHLNDSDPLVARTFREYLTLWQSSQGSQRNKRWTGVQVHHSLQFWHAIIRLWYLLLYSQHQIHFIVVIPSDKWFSASFNTRICG